MTLSILAMVFVGGLGLALQSAVNSRLRAGVGNPVLSALISFLVGAAALALVYAAGFFGRGRGADAGPIPWWAWIGGFFGAFYVTIAVIAVPRVGSALVIAGAVLGQLVASLALDSFGWFGVPRVPLTVWRVSGAILLFIGVLLMQRRG